MAWQEIFALVEGIISLVSFGFTVAIFLHSFYGRFKTFLHASVEIQEYLSTVRQGLYEERQHMKRIRKRKLPQVYDQGPPADFARDIRDETIPQVYDDAQGNPNVRNENNEGRKLYRQPGSPMRVIREAVKTLIREFKRAERPFLMLETAAKKEEDLEWSCDISGTKEYYNTDLKHRIIWLHKKSDITEISYRLMRLQQRRISIETTESHLMLADNQILLQNYGDQLKQMEHTLRKVSRTQGT